MIPQVEGSWIGSAARGGPPAKYWTRWITAFKRAFRMIEFLIAVEVKKIIQTRRSTEGASVERVERHVRKSAGSIIGA